MSVGRATAAAVAVLLTVAFSMPAVASAPAKTTSPKVAIPSGWTTYHHDNTRTGYDPNAPAFSGGPFSNWDKALDCQVYAEPLALSGVVYVVTMCNSIYAYDVASGNLLWSHVALASSTNGTHCSMGGNIGMMGTPVIDPSTGIIYAVGLTSTTLHQLS